MSNGFREFSQFFQQKTHFPAFKDFNKTKKNLDISQVWKGSLLSVSSKFDYFYDFIAMSLRNAYYLC